VSQMSSNDESTSGNKAGNSLLLENRKRSLL
jgi:hypothetical protein